MMFGSTDNIIELVSQVQILAKAVYVPTNTVKKRHESIFSHQL